MHKTPHPHREGFCLIKHIDKVYTGERKVGNGKMKTPEQTGYHCFYLCHLEVNK